MKKIKCNNCGKTFDRRKGSEVYHLKEGKMQKVVVCDVCVNNGSKE